MTKTTPTAPSVTVDIEQLTAEAQSQYADILELDAKKAALDLAYERAKAAKVIALGTTLSIIRPALPYGSWYRWLAANFNLTPRSAQIFINIAERFSNAQPVADFGYSQLIELLPLSADELPDFLQAMTANGTPAESLSKRALHKAVQSWRNSQPAEKTPVTIDVAGTVAVENMNAATNEPLSDELPAEIPASVTLTFNEQDTVTAATIFSTTPDSPTPTFIPAPALPLKYEQMTLFADYLPAPISQPQFMLPTAITEAASKLSVPVYLVSRPTKAEVPAPAVLVVLATARTMWLRLLIEKSTAFIEPVNSMAITMSDGTAARKSCVILFNGTELDKFADAFSRFGSANIPYTKKASALSTSKLS